MAAISRVSISTQSGKRSEADDCLFMGNADRESAYKLGNYKFSRNEMEHVFETRNEMNDAIKAAIEEIGLEECARCNED